MLYFDNLSRDTADEYLADGLTEELIARLRQIERLAVKSRTATQRYRGTSLDPTSLGRALSVAHLVSGSVRRSRERVRVAVELVRTASGVGIWGEQYDRTDVDLLAIQEDVARSVATAIAGRLFPAERAALAARSTRSSEAYDHFLRGNHLLAQRTPRAAARAIEEYEDATRLDAAFPRALARTAYAYALFLDWGWEHPSLPTESLLAEGLRAADSATLLDSTASDAWMARGYLLAQRDPTSLTHSKDALERGIVLDTGNAEAYHQYGQILVALEEDSAASAAYRHALALEPERAITLAQLATLMLIYRRPAEARLWQDSALQVDPGFAYGYAARARTHLLLGETIRARADAETAIRLGAGRVGQAALAAVEAYEGDTLAAGARIDSVMAGAGNPPVLGAIEGHWLSSAFVAARRRERAIDVLEEVKPRGWFLSYFLRLPVFDALRSHPRFQRLVEESRPR
ncbi:MAG TPA: hypothetical protein VFU41_03170 [Gemmatimonadales bacterium]|nr:hypothetical protein [Gemmatimonadales bacterium]